MHPPLFQVIDFPRFEDEFKLGGGEVIEDMTDGTPTSVRRASKRPETVSLLDPNRLRNVGKGLHNVFKWAISGCATDKLRMFRPQGFHLL